MTCPHLRYRILYKSKGSGLIAAAAYNSRHRIYDESEHRMKYPHAKNDDHILTQMLLPAGAPKSYSDPKRTWNDLLSVENDKTAYNIIIPFQKELTFEQNLQLAVDLLNDEFVSKGHCVQIDVHDQKDGNNNFHLHAIVSDRQLINGNWDLQKTETIYYRRGTVKQLDAKGKVINPDAVILTTNDKVDTPVLRKKKLQYDKIGNIIFEKGWQELQYDNNGKPLLDEHGHPVLIDIREPLYPPEYYKNKNAQQKLGDNKNKKGKIYKKKQWKKATIKHSDVSDNNNIVRLRQKWQDYQNMYYAKYNVLDENGETLKVDLRSYAKQNEERSESEQLIPSVHVMRHYEKENEMKAYNEKAKKHNNAVKATRMLSRRIKAEEEKLRNTENNIIALHQQTEKLYERINPLKLFVNAWDAGYDNMLFRRRTVENTVLENIEKHLKANDDAIKRIDRSTKRGEANYFRMNRHKATLFSFKTKLLRNINKSYDNIKRLASAKFDTLSNSTIVSFINKQYDNNTADVVADVLNRTRKDVISDKSTLPPDAGTNYKILKKSTKAIFGKDVNLKATEKTAIADWNKTLGEAPPAALLQVIDTFYTAEDYYVASLTGNKWRKQFFAPGEHPENINVDYRLDLAKIDEEEQKEKCETESSSAKNNLTEQEAWDKENEHLVEIREKAFNNYISAAQFFTMTDLFGITNRTKILNIVNKMDFDEKDELKTKYYDAANAVRTHFKKKPSNPPSDGKTATSKTVDFTPDHTNIRADNTIKK